MLLEKLKENQMIANFQSKVSNLYDSTIKGKINLNFRNPDMALKKQLMLVFMGISILPLVFMGFFTYNKAYTQVGIAQQKMLSAYAEGITSNIDTTIQSADNILKGLSAQSDLLVMLQDINNDGKLNDVIKLNNMLLSLKNAVKSSEKLYETIFITDIKGNVIADGSSYREVYTKMNITETDYFKEIKSGKKFVVGSPIESDATGKFVIPVAKSIDSLASQMGVMVIMFDLESFTNPIHDVTLGETGFVYIVSNTGAILHHKDSEKLLTKVENTLISPEIEKMEKGEEIESGFGFYKNKNENKVAAYQKLQNTNWLVVAAMDKGEYISSTIIIRNFIFFMVAALIIISLLVSMLYSQSITEPIRKLAQLMKKVSEGHLKVKADLHTSYEIGILNDSFNSMVSDLNRLIERITTASYEVANAAEKLTNTSYQAYDFTSHVSKIVEEIAIGASNQAQDVVIGVSKVNVLAEAIHDANSYTSIIYETTKDTDLVVRNGLEQIKVLSQKSKEGYDTSIKIHDVVVALEQEIKQIARVANTITMISKQTNLLALNAAIESARAGEAGRGFSVVAEEIRRLAEQVGRETATIRGIIQSIEDKAKNVDDVVRLNEVIVEDQTLAVKDTEKAFTTIFESIQEMSQNVNNITCAIEGMNKEKETIIETVSEISQIANETATSSQMANATAQQQFATIEEIKQYANELSELANNLKGSIEAFKE